jgi:hypothetical protein
MKRARGEQERLLLGTRRNGAKYSLVLMLLMFHSAATLTSLKGKGTMRDTWT